MSVLTIAQPACGRLLPIGATVYYKRLFEFVYSDFSFLRAGVLAVFRSVTPKAMSMSIKQKESAGVQ